MKYDICVFGGCSIDQMFYQNVDGSYNKTPDAITPGGKGANQAVAAARAGAKTTIISKLGKDKIGQSIIDNLKTNFVDTSHIELIDGLQNDYSDIHINIKDKDNDIKRYSGAIDSFTVDMIDNNKQVLLNSNIIVCQLKCPLEVTERLIDFCHKNSKTIILTPCRPQKLVNRNDLIDKITIITCNKKECQEIFKTDNIEECIKKYPNKLIVTLGSEGLIYYNGKRIIHMPAIDTNVLDTTGAGDTLNGNLAALLSKGVDLKHALRKAMYASSLKIQVKSAQKGMPYKNELEKFISRTRNKKFKYSNELNYAIELIKESYYLVKTNKNFQIYEKRDNTLVTNVDTTIENFLLKHIKEKFPNDNFLTEENYPKNKLKNRSWIIDPIDGTSHFIKNDNNWGIQLAFFDEESTKFSVIYLPKIDEFYYAAENQGAYLNNHKIINNGSNIPLNQCIVEFGGSIYKELENKKIIFNKLLENKKLIVGNVLHINSCCISYTNLVSKRTDALIISSKKKWDIMPGEFLCKEAGIKLYHLDFDNKITLLTDNDSLKKLLLKECVKNSV